MNVDDYRAEIRRVIAGLVPCMPSWEEDGHLPRELFRALAAAGAFRERWALGPVGGLPLARVLVEELAVHNAGAALAVSLHSEVFLHALHRAGGQAEILEGALDGSVIGCAAVTEPGAGSDVPAVTTSARREGDRWRLTGTKCLITNAGRATHVLVLARTGDARSFGLFVVPLSGVTPTRFVPTLGVRSADTAVLDLDVTVPSTAVVGNPRAGLVQLLRVLDFERLAAAAGLIATARAAMALALAHMRDRTAFSARLFDHQVLRHRMAWHWARVSAVAALLDVAMTPVHGDEVSHSAVAAAKLVAARDCADAVDAALQAFGGRGYTEDFPLARMYRDVRLTRIGGGTDEMLCEVIAANLDTDDSLSATLVRGIAERGGW
ncbi:citronellyl-CoA dehydrogenase [Lentzea albidocapillata subsp. violacea]|uniref:Medium-chain specific acyl-CoA dehydrogenase, mitochondrial n=1 Tax=Lentzea albidocapillata subsp. violacea TaxID=128104 RepID=A0A1G8TY88_9PSEU|nr:acyl-CoA dehydrogenase family protein [Lentzea albidocapillata]SDJ46471.1 citronellyl-CoA dehydrogenase [Lentzea albidocapillata subsp. violacea]